MPLFFPPIPAAFDTRRRIHRAQSERYTNGGALYQRPYVSALGHLIATERTRPSANRKGGPYAAASG